MSRNALLGDKYRPLFRVPPLLVMDALLSGQVTVLVMLGIANNASEFPTILSAMLYLTGLAICVVCFMLPYPILGHCYKLGISMMALQMSRWWNRIFLQKLDLQNSISASPNSTILSDSGDGGELRALQLVFSDEFLFYLSVQVMYSFVFTKMAHVLNVASREDADISLLYVSTCLMSPVFMHLLLCAVPIFPPNITNDIIRGLYFLYPILPILLMNISLLSFFYDSILHVRVIIRTYISIYKRFGIQVLVENQWMKFQVPTVLKLFWLTRFGLHLGTHVLQNHYASSDFSYTTGHFKAYLSTLLYDVAVYSCNTSLAVIGLSATISPIANAIGHLARRFLRGDRDGGENIGTVASVLFFILAVQTGLPDLTPENRVIRLGRNLSLLSTAILHFIHTMLHNIMMQLSTIHVINKQRHARALIMAAMLIFLPIWFIAHLWQANPIGTWMLALTAFCLELIVKVIVTVIVYTLFIIDTQSDTYWEHLDDYVYYVKATGSTIEFISGIFLFINGAWIFTFESRGVIRAIMICIHAYFNIFQLGKDGWKKFQNRRMAVKKIKHMDQASPVMLASHNDVCAICYQDLNSACITPCGHLFHAMCLRKWLYVQDSCPLCHKEILVNNDSEEKQVEGSDGEEVDNDPQT